MYTSLLKAVIDSSSLRPASGRLVCSWFVHPAICRSLVSAYTRLYAPSRPLVDGVRHRRLCVHGPAYARPLSNFPTGRRFRVLDLINTISLTFVTDRRVPIGFADKDEFKYHPRDLCPLPRPSVITFPTPTADSLAIRRLFDFSFRSFFPFPLSSFLFSNLLLSIEFLGTIVIFSSPISSNCDNSR